MGNTKSKSVGKIKMKKQFCKFDDKFCEINKKHWKSVGKTEIKMSFLWKKWNWKIFFENLSEKPLTQKKFHEK